MKYLVLLMAAFLSACSNDGLQDLEKYTDDVKARPAGAIPPIPEIREIESYLYIPQGRRDPFTAETVVDEEEASVANNGIQPDGSRRKEELEAYSLDALEMVGTMEQEDASWGLVKTKDGMIHRVQLGDYLGLNHGRIVAINEDKIQLLEIVRNGNGYLEQEAIMAIGEREE